MRACRRPWCTTLALLVLASGCAGGVDRAMARVRTSVSPDAPSVESTPLPPRSQRVSLRQTGVNAFDVECLNFEAVAVAQRDPLWCWAASAEMVSRYSGTPRKQEEIVVRVSRQNLKYPWSSDGANEREIWLALAPEMEGAVERWHEQIANAHKNKKKITIKPHNQRNPAESRPTTEDDVVEELSSGRPVLVGLSSGRWGGGHVVVAYAVNYSRRYPQGPAQYQDRNQLRPFSSQYRLNSLRVIDPMPDADGNQQVELDAAVLRDHVAFYLDRDTAARRLRGMMNGLVVR